MKLATNYETDAQAYALQRTAILGIPDAGKTYTAMKVAECLLDAGISIIAFDPVGVWKNLKVGINGNNGYPIVVAGGEHPDIVLTKENVTEIVRAAMKEGVSLVIDLYSIELSNKSTWIKIVQEAVDLLMYENKPYGLRHIFIEEAAEFVPQRIMPNQNQVYSSVERLVRMGRNAKLGITVINQRAESVNKEVLELCKFSLLHQQTGKNSLLSVKKWLDVMHSTGVPEIMKSLPELRQGECWVIGKGQDAKRIQVLPRKTFHPKGDEADGEAATTASVADVGGFVERMRKQLGEKEAKPVVGQTISYDKKLMDENRTLKEELSFYKSAYWAACGEIVALGKKYTEGSFPEFPQDSPGANIVDQKAVLYGVVEENLSLANGEPPKHGTMTTGPSDAPSGGKLRMLKAAAMFASAPISKQRMAMIAGMSAKSGTFGTYLSGLKKEGLLEDAAGGTLCATAAGVKAAGSIDKLPTDSASLVKLWCDVLGPNSGPSRILRHVAKHHPRFCSKKEIGAATNLSPASGTFGTYLSTLKRVGLVVTGKEGIKGSDELFGK